MRYLVKIHKIACDVRVRTYTMKIIREDRVLFGLSFDVNLEWHMPFEEIYAN